MFLKKLSQELIAKSPFFNLRSTENNNFLENPLKEVMFHYQLFYSVQLAFLVLGSIFDGGVFAKNSHILLF